MPGLQSSHGGTFIYVIIGKPHPAAGADGRKYVANLETQVIKLNLSTSVHFWRRYMDYESLANTLKAADVFVAPYSDSSVSSSGTLSMAMAAGLAPIATPFYYAKTVLRSGRGQLMEFRSAASPRAIRHNLYIRELQVKSYYLW